MSQNNNSRTRAFEAVDNRANESRRKVVIAIFVVVALILAAFATLIIGKIASNLPEKTPIGSKYDTTTVLKDSGDVKIGNLLYISKDSLYTLPTDFSNMINVYNAQRNDEYAAATAINGKITYSLSRADIALEINTFNSFNQMIIDYCNESVDLLSANSDSASNLIIAWGGYLPETIHEYEGYDLPTLGYDYYDHILGTTLVLKRYSDSARITEDILKNDFSWIYQNAYKYGFILLFPNACAEHTKFDSKTRLHLRYVGAEHATYIYENQICFQEYLALLRDQHNSLDKALTVESNGSTYLVYYIKETGNPTSIPVPKNSEYTISGDNMNGFIVSVKQ